MLAVVVYYWVTQRDQIGETVVHKRVENLHKHGRFYVEKEDYPMALELFQLSLSIAQEHFPPEKELVQTCLHNVAWAEMLSGDYEGSLARFLQLYELRVRLYGADERITVVTQTNLATVNWHLGNLDAAEGHYRDILVKKKAKYGRNHRHSVIGQQHLAIFLRETGHFEEAIQILEESLEILRAHFEPENPRIRVSLLELGLAYLGKQDFISAEHCFFQLQELHQQHFSPGHPKRLHLASLIAFCYREMFLFEEALHFSHEVVDFRKEANGTNHLLTSAAYFDLGLTYAAAGDRSMATQCFTQAKLSSSLLLGEAHPWYRQMMGELERMSGEVGFSARNLVD